MKGLIRDGENGFFFDPASSDAVEHLASRLSELAANPDLARKMANSGMAEVKEKYTWSKVTEQLEQVYADAEERHR